MNIEITAQDFEFLTVAGMDLNQMGEPLWSRQPGRFENYSAEDVHESPRKAWQWAHWIDDAYAGVMLAKAFLLDNGYDFELFYDTCYPTEWGGWVIFTDYHRER